MRVFLVTMSALAITMAVPASTQSRAAGALQTRRVFVTVLDRNHKPLTDLGPADFEVTENNVTRQIVKASLAEGPTRRRNTRSPS